MLRVAHCDSAALAPPTAGVDPLRNCRARTVFPVDGPQLLDRSLGLIVRALAEVLEADTPVAIDEVERWPVVVL